MSIEANLVTSPDLRDVLASSVNKEESQAGKAVLRQFLESQDIVETEKIPICQDTGFAVVYLEVGMDVRLTGGSLTGAVNQGVRKGYSKGSLRKTII